MKNNLQLTENPKFSDKSFSVSELNSIISDILDSGFPAQIWIEGEISNYSLVGSGHRYFSLKDNNSSVSCALFKGSANRINSSILQNLKNGDKIIVKANISVYKPRGTYQLIVSDIEEAGFGKLAKEFAELKLKLEKLGMTGVKTKKTIPTWAKQIAIITSATGAAIADVISTLKRRAPFIPVVVYPSLVQGEKATQNIIKALKKINSNDNSDVILLVRGGGSLEDLQAFNNEELAFEVFNSKIPVITGVGHETDFTIVDFVSDYRAETPTAAAVAASPNIKDLQQSLNNKKSQLLSSMRETYKLKRSQLLNLNNRIKVQHPNRLLLEQNQKLDESKIKLIKLIKGYTNSCKVDLISLNKRLKLQHPKRVFIEQNQKLNSKKLQLLNSMREIYKLKRNQLLNLNNRLKVQHPKKILIEKNQNVNKKSQSLIKQINNLLENKKNYQKGLAARLKLLSPLGILDRGYSLTFDENKSIISSVTQVENKQNLKIWLKDGEISVIVTSKK